MAIIQTNINESVYSIKRWLGVNEAEEGESTLKNGEAAKMRNFRVTSGGALQKRPGSKNVVGLMAEYNVVTDTETETVLFSETGYSEKEITLYPRAAADSVGGVTVEGETISVDFEEASDLYGYFYDSGSGVFEFCDARHTDPELKETVTPEITLSKSFATPCRVMYFDTPPVFHDGEWDVSEGTVMILHDNTYSALQGKYILPADENGTPGHIVGGTSHTPDDFPRINDGVFGYVANINYSETYVAHFRFTIKLYDSQLYEWVFNPTHTEANSSDSQVRGIWSGFVNGSEVICAACNGHLWALSGEKENWSKASCGLINTENDVFMFGFDEKLYIMNGVEYKVWDGITLEDVEGYRPLVSVSVAPEGGGQGLEQVNKLTGTRRCRFSPDGHSTIFQLPETGLTSIDYVKDLVTDAEMTGYTVNKISGTVTFNAAPTAGVNTVEIGWTYPTDFSDTVTAMRYAELYNGVQDTRVFIYGDGSNKAFYSGLDYDGKARADYFPDLNECAVGASNTPITAMIRHYNKLLCFKTDSTWSIGYDTITLSDGTVTPGFYITPVNRDTGNIAPGQAVLVGNRPRTLDGRSVIEWKATSSSGNITGDQRNAERVSRKVGNTIRAFELESTKAFYDKVTSEYYVIDPLGIALVNNVDADAWYIYTGFDAVCMINYKDEVYYGTADGYLRRYSSDYLSDNGEPIDALWESGAMDFSQDFRRKYSAMLWVGLKPEDNGYLAVTAETDRKSDFAEYTAETFDEGAVPEMERIKLKAKKFTYYKLIFKNNKLGTTATVVSADIRVRGTGYVR